MPLVCYVPTNFKPAALQRIEQANAIIADYRDQGLTLTLRQLYYRLVANGTIPNNFRSYKNLQRVINDARLAGLVDWYAIEDRTRNLHKRPSWDSPEDILDSCALQYRRNPWDTQDVYVEVWVEKDALLGVIEKACREHRVPYFSCRGYTSQSEVWHAAQRLKATGRDCVVLHLGDHDPSGVDMTRDIEDRFHLFGAHRVTVDRLALNMDQIRALNPPPNPVKTTDSRSGGYEALYGVHSWELDALEPNYIIDLIHKHVKSHIDFTLWGECLKQERDERATLGLISQRYDDVTHYLNQDTEDE